MLESLSPAMWRATFPMSTKASCESEDKLGQRCPTFAAYQSRAFATKNTTRHKDFQEPPAPRFLPVIAPSYRYCINPRHPRHQRFSKQN